MPVLNFSFFILLLICSCPHLQMHFLVSLNLGSNWGLIYFYSLFSPPQSVTVDVCLLTGLVSGYKWTKRIMKQATQPSTPSSTMRPLRWDKHGHSTALSSLKRRKIKKIFKYHDFSFNQRKVATVLFVSALSPLLSHTNR